VVLSIAASSLAVVEGNGREMGEFALFFFFLVEMSMIIMLGF